MPLRAVIFDMDGVIVDSEPRHERAFREVIRELGYSDAEGLCFADYIGRSDRDLWVDFIARYKPSQTIDQLLALKRARVIQILQREEPLFDGLPELVEKLASKYRLAVASGSEQAVVHAVLDFRGLRRFFSAIVSSAEVEQGKPAPDIFLLAAERLGVPTAECCVIEDSKPGIAAAVAAGMQVIAITNTHPAEELSRAGEVVSTYTEIESLLLFGRSAFLSS